MRITQTAIEGVLILEPEVHADARGYFTVCYEQRSFDSAIGQKVRFVQDSHSHSTLGVLRGLHYQSVPHAQGRLVRVTSGAVFDVGVDLRSGSPTYGHWVGTELSAENHRMVWLPPGLAHGFLVTSGPADFHYKSTHAYEPQAERSLRWNDPRLAIAWPDLGFPPLLSPRDASAPFFEAV